MRAWLRRWANTPLRPLPAAQRPPLWALGAAVAVLTWLQMVRRPAPPPVWDSLYVEDGQVFLATALADDLWDALATSYYGYLHTAPRLIAEASTAVSIERAPLVTSLLTTLTVALLAVFVFLASAAWIRSAVLRGALAVAFVLLPVTARDIVGTVANLHWFLVYAAFWAVVCPWRTRGWLAASTAVVGLAVLSDPLTGVLLPLAVAFAVRSRAERRAWLMPALVVAGLLAQLVLRDDSAEPFGSLDAGAVPRIFAERVTSSLLAGDRYLHGLFGGHTGSPFAWASLAVVAGAVGFGLWRLRGRRAWLLGGGAALSLVFFLIPVVSRGTSVFAPDEPWVVGASRYVYLPVMFLLTGLLAAVDRDAAEARRPPWRELAVALAVLAVVAVNYRAPSRTQDGPRWGPAVRQARADCRTRPPGATAVIPIIQPEIWYVAVSCSQLR